MHLSLSRQQSLGALHIDESTKKHKLEDKKSAFSAGRMISSDTALVKEVNQQCSCSSSLPQRQRSGMQEQLGTVYACGLKLEKQAEV